MLRVAGVGGVVGERYIVGLRPGRDDNLAPLLVAEYDERAPDLSPDGRGLAYRSNETGEDEVFVRPFPDVESGKWQVSTNGGMAPGWAQSGDELFYANGDDELVAAKITTDPTFRVESRETLFQYGGEYTFSNITRHYDISQDDQSFLMVRPSGSEEEVVNELIVVENFVEDLKRRVPN